MNRTRAAELLPLVPAAAVPLVYLHVRYQAHLVVGPANVYGSDILIALTVLAAISSGVLFGWDRVLRPRLLWATAAALLGLLVLSNFWRPLEDTTGHLVTAAKYGEYALLAPAAVLLFRRRVDIDRFFWAFTAWCGAASVWGLLQFLGIVKEFEGFRPGQREVSFLGHEDFGAFAGATFVVGLAYWATGEHPRLAQAALAAGALGLVMDSSISAFGGTIVAALLALVVGRRLRTMSWRRVAAVAAALALLGAGVNTLRGSDVSSYLSFLGIHKATSETGGVATGSQRALLFYIGLRIWEDHPWLGVGFERSENRYQPYLAAAKRRYPGQPAQAFPGPGREWGIQNLWLQLAADTGVVGLALGLATFGAGLLTAFRSRGGSRLVALVAAGWILVAAATWNAIGIVSGIPLDATTWLALGLAAAAQSLASEAKHEATT